MRDALEFEWLGIPSVAVIADARDARRILERLGVWSEAPQAARARDPTHLDDEQHASP